MSTNKSYVPMCDLCPDCLDERSRDLWLVYYNQYYIALKTMLYGRKQKSKETILPLLLLLSQYMELWIKVIAMNYGMGAGVSVKSEIFTGHNNRKMLEGMLALMDDEEYYKFEDLLDEIFFYYEDFCELTATDEVSIAEAARYPLTRKNTATLCVCLLKSLDDDCERFDYKTIFRNAKRLLTLTYEVFSALYDDRVLPM